MSSKRKIECSNARPMKRSRRLELKPNVHKMYSSGLSSGKLTKRRPVSKGSASSVLKYKRKCKKAIGDQVSKPAVSVRYNRKGLIPEMEKVLLPWINAETQKLGQPLSRNVISEKALNIFENLKKKHGLKADSERFCASKSWYQRFMIRASIRNFERKDETTEESMNNFIEIIKKEGYTSDQIFIIAQTSLYWKQFPIMASPFLSNEEKKVIKKKGNKKRMILLLGSNASGDLKLKPLVVYPSINPKAFMGLDKSALPVIWKYHAKSLITPSIFDNWFTSHFMPEVQLYCKKKSLQYKAMIVFDNSIRYSERLIQRHSNIKIVSLPPSANKLIQPLDLNIIKTFKENYVHKVSVKMLKYVSDRKRKRNGKKDFWKCFNVKDAVNAIDESWNEISKHYLYLVWKKRSPELFSRDKKFYDFFFQISRRMFKLIDCFSSLHLEESIVNVDDCDSSLNIGHFLDCVIQELD